MVAIESTTASAQGKSMKKQSLTAGQIAGRLAAEKIKPLVQYVEQATGTKLQLPDQELAHKPKAEQNARR